MKTSQSGSKANQSNDRELDAGKDIFVDAKEAQLEYRQTPLTIKDLDPVPLKQFQIWFEEAHGTEKQLEYNTMGVTTFGLDGYPDARYVLLKEISKGGFVFFTNYDSAKGKEIEANPRISLLFYWPTQNRQVRVKGTAEKLTAEENDAYFNQRATKSKAGAIASHQSHVISDDKTELVKQIEELTQKAEKGEIELKRPDNWGGYRVMPRWFEFWQGEKNRDHDVFEYVATDEAGKWKIERLSP